MSENRKPPDWGDGPPDEDPPVDEPPEPPEPTDDLAELRSRRARRELEKALDDIDDEEDNPAFQMEEGFDLYLCGDLGKAVECWLASVEANPGIAARLLSWEDEGLLRRLDARKLKQAWACVDETWWVFYTADPDAWMTLLAFWCRPAVQRMIGADAFGVLMGWSGGPSESKAIHAEVQAEIEGVGTEWEVRGEIGETLYQIASFLGDLDKEGRGPEDLPQGPYGELRAHQAALQKRALEIARDGLSEDAALDEVEGWEERSAAVGRIVAELREALPPVPPRVLPETPSLDGLCPCGSGQKFMDCCGRRAE